MCSTSEAVVTAALLFVAYTYAGYPAWCWLRARLRPLPIERSAAQPTVTVVIAAWREASTIAAKLESLNAQSYPPERLDVIIACDGSDDGTPDAAKRAAQVSMPGRVTVLELSRAGKPAALNAAVAAAKGEILVMTDARQPLSQDAITVLVADLGDPTVGVAGGALELAGGTPAGAYWRYEAMIRKAEGRSGSTVGVSGALYAIRRADFTPMPAETILDDVLVPMRVRLRSGRRVVFDPEAIAYDHAAEIGREFRRKVRTLSGNFQLLVLEPGLLNPLKNPSFFDFVSHKLCRLVVPFALLAIAVASPFVRAPFAGVLIAGQAGSYGLAFVHGLGIRLPFAGLFNTFVVLNAAAVVGLLRFVRHGRRLPW